MRLFAGGLVMALVVAGLGRVAAAPQSQAPAAEPMLKVDVVLTRHRTAVGGQDAVQRETALKTLERSEVLFDKGLISQQQLDAARLQAAGVGANDLISRLPYSLFVAVGPTSQRTSLRVGVDVPGEPSTTTSKDGVTTTSRPARYVGTLIDSSATPAGDGRYRLYLSIQDSSVLPADQSREFVSPVIRSYSSSNYLYVRDGQTLTFSVGTDRLTGETLRAEVTVAVVK
jgi:hypothetical protein